LTDEQLIKNIRAGENNSFRELVKKYEQRVASTVMGMLGNCPEADDVGQETFIRFYNSIDKFRGDSSVGTFLTRIAMNLSLNELKRRQRKNLFFRRQIESDFNVPDKARSGNSSEAKEIIQKALEKLEANFKAVLVLRLIEGYSTSETAEILKLPIGTVLSRLARAQKKLKEILTPLMGEWT
jgi:RNA polymerase sigma-70 factor, ECF subfamily